MKVLITGANGKVGSALISYLKTNNPDYILRLGDLKICDDDRSIHLDITDPLFM